MKKLLLVAALGLLAACSQETEDSADSAMEESAEAGGAMADTVTSAAEDAVQNAEAAADKAGAAVESAAADASTAASEAVN